MRTASSRWEPKDIRTGEQNTIEVQPSYGLNDSDIERMLEESIEYAEQDFAERQVIEARTEAEIDSKRDVQSTGESERGSPFNARACEDRCFHCRFAGSSKGQRLQIDTPED